MKLSSGLRRLLDEYKNRPETKLELGFRQRAKLGLMMRESQCLDTDLNRRRDFTGNFMRIWVKMSSLAATLSIGDENTDMRDLGEYVSI